MTRLLAATLLVLCGLTAPCLAGADVRPQAAAPSVLAAQMEQYHADVPKSVVELQPFRLTRSQPVTDSAGRKGTATLVDLNPAIGRWYLLALDWGDGKARHFHLENDLSGQTVALDPEVPGGLMLRRDGQAYRCELWSDAVLDEAISRPTPYAPLCEGRLHLRNAVKGHSSRLEAVVEFMRRHVPAGERLISATKQTVLEDSGREPAEIGGRGRASEAMRPMPIPVRLAAEYQDREIGRGSLGIAAGISGGARQAVGQWVPIPDLAGAFVNLMAPEAIAPEILRNSTARANALDGRESAALVYAVAFDLERFDLGFGLGTDHPGVGWSPRPPDAVRKPALPGPDGIDTVRPLVSTGTIPPGDQDRTVATFVGGFKRYHGAFKYGALALRNRGTHYGFVQEGVILSKLQPGLSTLYVLRDGSVRMHAWTEADDARLPEIRYARQNGVPLVEWDTATDAPVPGALVNQWGAGNWSGSAEGALRTVRGGVCLQETPDTQYLIYAYFSSATPSAMARVFQAYRCRHAMQLDINAPILTYLAIYSGVGPELRVQYLVQSMVEAEQKVDGRPVPRFLIMPDNRDFFYLMRRDGNSR